jgi:hypothetical protein
MLWLRDDVVFQSESVGLLLDDEKVLLRSFG